MRHAFALLAIWLITGQAEAQTIRVQTGEHASFTRIVLLTGQALEWRAGRHPEGFAIRFKDANLSIDLNGAFRLIPRDRIQGLSWQDTDSTLVIESTCACHLDVFEDRQGVLVLDVKSGSAPKDHTFEAAILGQSPAPSGGEPSRLSATLPIIASLPEHTVPFPVRNTRGPDGSVTLADNIETSLRALPPEMSGLRAEDGAATTANGDLAAMSELIESALDAHIQIRTGKDPRAAPQADETPSDCPGPGVAAVSSWGNDSADPLSGIWTGNRVSLITEEGHIAPDRVISHVKRLVHAGLGTEAIAHLALLTHRDVETDLLRDLAHLVDATPDYRSSRLQAYRACTDEIGLWALLASEDAEPDPDADLSHVQGLFNHLPAHLQQLVGTRLVQKLLSLGHIADAQTLLAAIERRQAASASALQALHAEIALQKDDFESAEAHLGAVIYDNSELSPEALLNLLRTREDRAEAAPEDLLLLTEGFIHELAGTALATELRAAAIRSYARSGHFEPAVAYLRSYPERESATYDTVRSDLAQRLAELAPDNTFLIQVFSLDLIFDHAGLGPTAKLALSKRLVTLGFLEEARTILEGIQTADDAVAVLRAEIALGRGRAEEALDHLRASTSKEATRLRAQAESALGRHAESVQSFAALDAARDARLTAWASNEDALIGAFGSPSEQGFVSALADIGTGVSLAEQAERATTAVTYEEMRDLLSGALGFRRAAQEILAQQQ